uniref:hypothetical protein n=1 Tax=Lentilactobacillus hilgardii TaxID=1588 RepID=UPI00403F7CFC
MAEEHSKKRPNFLENRIAGNIKPKETFDESIIDRKSAREKFKYQQKNLKVSKDQMDRIDAAKRLSNLSFNYEVIQMLLDDWTSRLSPSDKKKFENYIQLVLHLKCKFKRYKSQSSQEY